MPLTRMLGVSLALALAWLGCTGAVSSVDAGPRQRISDDAGTDDDAGSPSDSGTSADAGRDDADAGGSPPDGGQADAGRFDGGPRLDAGAPSDAGAPAWALAIPVGAWGVVANSNLHTSGVEQPGGDAIIQSYSGAVLNTKGVFVGPTFVAGQFLVPLGGGHTIDADEVYAFGPFGDPAPRWHRLRDRTVPGVQNVNADENGNPVSCHTYSGVVYTGRHNSMLRVGCLFRYSDVNSPPETYRFDFEVPSPSSAQPWSKGSNLLGGSADLAVYDPTHDRVWYRAAGEYDRINSYDYSTDTPARSSQSKTSHGAYYRSAAALDVKRGLWLSIGGGSYDFFRTDNGLENDWYVPATTGTAPTSLNAPCVWDAIGDRFVVWGDQGTTLFFLAPPSGDPFQGGDPWAWSSVTPTTGVTPSSGSPSGTFGRFQYLELGDGVRGFVLMNAADEPIFFFRAS